VTIACLQHVSFEGPGTHAGWAAEVKGGPMGAKHEVALLGRRHDAMAAAANA
jgi:hypothetical protein